VLHDYGGDGSPILLLHGLMGTSRTWRTHLPWMLGHGHVWGLDAAAHGASSSAGAWATDFRGRTAVGWLAQFDRWPLPFADAAQVLGFFGPVAGRYFLDSFDERADGWHLHGSLDDWFATPSTGVGAPARYREAVEAFLAGLPGSR